MTIYSAILGMYDNLRQPVDQTNGTRYICYSDVPRFDSHGWEIQPAPADSRIPKILSHHFAPGDSIWMDGCFRPKENPMKAMQELLNGCDVGVIEHPRMDAFREAWYCQSSGVGDAVAIEDQLKRYKAEGYPGGPFVCGGIIARRDTPEVREFNELWWSEYRDGQKRDQFALSYALWKTGVKVNVARGVDILQNPWFSFHFHAWCYDLSDNPQFADERKEMESRQLELRRLGAA